MERHFRTASDSDVRPSLTQSLADIKRFVMMVVKTFLSYSFAQAFPSSRDDKASANESDRRENVLKEDSQSEIPAYQAQRSDHASSTRL